MSYRRQYQDELHDSWGLEHVGSFDHASLRMWPGVPQLDPRQAYEDGKPVGSSNPIFTLIAGVYQPYGGSFSTIEYMDDKWLVVWRTPSSCVTNEHATEASAFEEFCQELMFQNPLDFVTNRPTKAQYDDSKGYGSWA